MNVADFIINFLSSKGVNTIFMVTGGQAMFLNDAVFRNKKIKPIFTHHEQAASMAAEAYGRTKGDLGVAMVTAGPGAINALNGVVGGWVDSSPMMIISGQTNTSVSQYMIDHPIRQYGVQGINTKAHVSASTKYFKTVDDPAKILYYLEKAYYLATTGRTGPVWLEVPLDMQRTEVPLKLLKKFENPRDTINEVLLKRSTENVISSFSKAKRPLIVAGQGIHIAKAEKEFVKLLKTLKPAVVTTRLGIDLINSNNPLFVGRPGLYGDRYANIAVQNADLILILGARMDTGIIGYHPQDWGRHAKKIVVDNDEEELKKPGIRIDLSIKNDISDFLQILNQKLTKKKMPSYTKWITICNNWKKRYPTVLPSYKNEHPVNSYYFTEQLSLAADKKDMILVDTSSPFHVVCQAWNIKLGQRFLTTGGISTMGYWPAGIGMAMTDLKKRTLILTGDGCLQMNLQELATIKQNNLPIKLFIFNNNGYLLIRHTQKTHMEGRFMGESPKTGLFIPDSIKIAKVYGIKGVRIHNTKELDKKIKEVLEYPGPVICDVMTPQWQLIIPRISSQKASDGTLISKPYEDLFPFLSTEELKANMVAEKSKSEVSIIDEE
ncbi:MAG TPA: thiamine pyrophosphate-binding protein [Candidatus Acidoferrales bacterium]|nr:thiamine pyrophosphate-binding protein [Candidatus Acidoferrales bacterium]